MATLQTEVIKDLYSMMTDIGNPTFSWQGNSYPCIASLTDFEKDLEMGGSSINRLLYMTVPRYNSNGNPLFPSDSPPGPKQIIIYNGDSYRIESLKRDVLNSRIRFLCRSITVGV